MGGAARVRGINRQSEVLVIQRGSHVERVLSNDMISSASERGCCSLPNDPEMKVQCKGRGID